MTEKSTVFQTTLEKNEERESSLRPSSFADFVGQEKTVERLKVMAEGALARKESLKHILLSGPPGLGKTTLALLLGKAMDVQVRVTSGPVISKAADLAGLLTNLEHGDILFIDEIHRIPKQVEEYLYSAMEDFVIDILIDQGPNARSIRLNLPPFTLVGATTRTGLLSAPLRSRFTLQSRLDYYTKEDLKKILIRTGRLLSVRMEDSGATELARRSRGTPRIANNLIYFVRDYAERRAQGYIDGKVTQAALDLLEIDQHGLDELDKRLLQVIAENYKGGPVGIGTLSAVIGEEESTLEEVHEPYLLQEGFLKRTPQGRVLSEKAWGVLGIKMPRQETLF